MLLASLRLLLYHHLRLSMDLHLTRQAGRWSDRHLTNPPNQPPFQARPLMNNGLGSPGCQNATLRGKQDRADPHPAHSNPPFLHIQQPHPRINIDKIYHLPRTNQPSQKPKTNWPRLTLPPSLVHPSIPSQMLILIARGKPGSGQAQHCTARVSLPSEAPTNKPIGTNGTPALCININIPCLSAQALRMKHRRRQRPLSALGNDTRLVSCERGRSTICLPCLVRGKSHERVAPWLG